ncbi:MAG TPA: PSD1 and planctomycete cytochrome C domain-containing protein [Verrucomicrobiae bacterium]|nr:PSD1 and planctomycete cytochrome C domain-containing protein [Verrucomicrobiae bacterium]
MIPRIKDATRKLTIGLGWLALAISTPAAETISYNRDVRPILSDNCFQCHGPDEKTRKGKFRLDVREDAVAKGAIEPGKPNESELITRVFTKNPDDLMPPGETHKQLTDAQKKMLRNWIAAGAKYEAHWAYVPPIKPSTPPKQNAIDVLVRQRLRTLGLKPSRPADRRTLARRLYFDLVGLPPGPEDVEAFAQDKSPDAVSRLIEKLMTSPQFGERMAIGWLDVVRFADTIGYHSDNPRNIWPYRDYVIKAFNENKPFDQFTREQIAGDLLPQSTREQKVASAFNRLLLSTEEGGAQPKDYEARMLTDRVRAISTVWLGQTIGCAQCHDHKFDPITQRDFYSLGAFFADIEEPIIGAREPGMLLPNEEQAAELKRLEEEIARAKRALDGPNPDWDAAFVEWQKAQLELVVQERRWQALTPANAETDSDTKLTIEQDRVLAKGTSAKAKAYTLTFTNEFTNLVGLRVEALPHDSLPSKGPGRASDGNFVLTEVVASITRPDGSTNAIPFRSARADFEQTQSNGTNNLSTGSAAAVIDGDVNGATVGWSISPQTNQAHQLVLGFAAPVTLQSGETLRLEIQQNVPKHALGHFRLGVTTNTEALQGPLSFPPPKEISDLLLIAADQREPKQNKKLYAHFKETAPETAEARKRLAEARKAKADFEGTLPRCIVSKTNTQPRTVRILPRGNFLDETGATVQPALPAYLVNAKGEAPGRRLNRLDLANWLVSPDNPLTARVVMNRLWKQFFGVGLSKVVDDLGRQGELPPNQPLLDWLACEFQDSGWDLKHMVRLIVNSQTYQQTSVPTKKLRERDPFNRALAVQSRWRLDAELVRDNALAVSGLLVDKIGGPSVKPYQPEGYWENLNFPVRSYTASTGPDQYRRGLYVWWQRSYLHPSLLAFDASTREECAAERNRSNIPQQALVLLNDPTYVEASRALATRILKEGGSDTKTRITWAWREVLSRLPRTDELKTIQALLEKQLAEYRADPNAAEKFANIGQTPPPKDSDLPELAAWTNIARAILNLHETITRS